MEWISVDDRLPKNSESVNVWMPENKRVLPCTFIYKDFEIYSIEEQEWFKPNGTVTHWMPLPEPPN